MTNNQREIKRAIPILDRLPLCSGCGACVGVCPANVLELAPDKAGALVPRVKDADKCVYCGLCAKVCSRGRSILTQNPLTESPDVETFVESRKDARVFVAHSSDAKYRRECASGGATTGFLIWALRSGKIDGAIVVRRDENDPLACKAVLARSVDDVFDARGSKYLPVDYSAAFSLIKSAPDDAKLAVVGLPCQLASLQACLERFPKQRSKVLFTIALVCGRTPSMKAYDYLFKKCGVPRDQVKKLSNRGDGWPGYLTIEDKNGNKWSRPYGSKYSQGMLLSSPFLENHGCHICADPMGFSADFVISDAWLKEYRRDDNPGDNLVLIANEERLPLFQEAVDSGALEAQPETFERFVLANRRVFYRKSYGVAAGELLFLRKSDRNQRLAERYRRLKFGVKARLWFLCANAALYRKFASFAPVSAPLLIYGKILARFCGKAVVGRKGKSK